MKPRIGKETEGVPNDVIIRELLTARRRYEEKLVKETNKRIQIQIQIKKKRRKEEKKKLNF